MKNYLEDNLSKDEKSEISGIIWMTVKNHKYNMYNDKISLTLNESSNIIYNDLYFFEDLKFKDFAFHSDPLTKFEKSEILLNLDVLMDELDLSFFYNTLTYNEKLVFFFIIIEKYKQVKVSTLLSIDRKTIYNCKKSIEDKIRNIKMKGYYYGK